MYRLVCTMYISCTHVYIQIERHISRFILCSDQVYTRTLCICIHDSVHTCSNIVHTMYIPSIYIECTSSSLHVHRIQKQKVACVWVQTHDLVQTAALP